jgi:GNAT superfamily N-acetyltransferase
MRKIIIGLLLFSGMAHAMDKPIQPDGNQKKRKVFELLTNNKQTRFDHACSEWLKPFYHTSSPQLDPVEQKETITATHKNREVGSITFSDNIDGKDTDMHATHGFIHDLEVVPELRGQHIGTDLFAKACRLLKQRGVCLITWYARAPIREPNGLKKLGHIFHSMAHEAFSYNRFSMREILFNEEQVGRRMQIKFKDEPKRLLPPIRTKEQALAAKTPIELPSEKKQKTPLPVDFLKEYICEEKKSGDTFAGNPELEFTIPVADDLYDNSYSIDLREAKTGKIAAQVTYGQELEQKNVGSIHYFYMKPAFFSKGIGYPFFKRAIDELTKLGYKKINWKALVQKPEMTRASLHESIKYFAHQIQNEGFACEIDATSSPDFVTLHLIGPCQEAK